MRMTVSGTPSHQRMAGMIMPSSELLRCEFIEFVLSFCPCARNPAVALTASICAGLTKNRMTRRECVQMRGGFVVLS